jgi:predicted SAM-dependent methyltransferase
VPLKKLNVGCGHDIRKGWINLDSVELPGVDIIYNIQKTPLPFDNDEFDIILCQDIFEHIEYIPVFKDLHRILKKGGIITIRVPHFTSRRNYNDPTHKKMFSIRTFEYFVKNSRANRDYYFNFHFDKIIYSRIIFEKYFYLYNYLIELIINANRKLKETIYEATFLSRLFPADYLVIKLRK